MSALKHLLLYSPVIVLLAWALFLGLGASGKPLTIAALVVLAFASGAHIREELRRV